MKLWLSDHVYNTSPTVQKSGHFSALSSPVLFVAAAAAASAAPAKLELCVHTFSSALHICHGRRPQKRDKPVLLEKFDFRGG